MNFEVTIRVSVMMPTRALKLLLETVKKNSGMVIESQIRVSERHGSGYGQLNFVMNLYHTKSKLMVNGKEAALFNAEHQKIIDSILATEEVSRLDQDMFGTIMEDLKTVNLKRTSPKKNPRKKDSILAIENVSNGNKEPTPNGPGSVCDPLNLHVDLELSPENELESFLCHSCAKNADRGAIFCDA